MNPIRWTIVGTLAVIGIAAGLLWYEGRGYGDNRVVVTIDGPPGSSVRIALEVDGEISATDAPLPASVSRTAYDHFKISINLMEGQIGPMSVELLAGGRSCGRVTSNRGVLGRLAFEGGKISLKSLTGL